MAALLLGLYVAGAVRLARRGDRWPVLRTVCWVLGCLVLVWATGGAAGVYGRVLFSAHMLGHMTMSMVVPALLVLGAPGHARPAHPRARAATAAGARASGCWPSSTRGSWRCSGHPLVAAGLFAGSLVAFYYSPLFELSLRTHTGHVLMHAHFLLVGYLFANVLIGIDPGPAAPAVPDAAAPAVRHHGVPRLLRRGAGAGQPAARARTCSASLGRTWGRSPLADQQYGGAVAWGVGELPVLLLGMGIAIAWVRSDDREARRQRPAGRPGRRRRARRVQRPAGPAGRPQDDDEEVRR